MVRFLSEGPIAVATNEANTQHYEVKPDFYKKYWESILNIVQHIGMIQ